MNECVLFSMSGALLPGVWRGFSCWNPVCSDKSTKNCIIPRKQQPQGGLLKVVFECGTRPLMYGTTKHIIKDYLLEV